MNNFSFDLFVLILSFGLLFICVFLYFRFRYECVCMRVCVCVVRMPYTSQLAMATATHWRCGSKAILPLTDCTNVHTCVQRKRTVMTAPTMRNECDAYIQTPYRIPISQLVPSTNTHTHTIQKKKKRKNPMRCFSRVMSVTIVESVSMQNMRLRPAAHSHTRVQSPKCHNGNLSTIIRQHKISQPNTDQKNGNLRRCCCAAVKSMNTWSAIGAIAGTNNLIEFINVPTSSTSIPRHIYRPVGEMQCAQKYQEIKCDADERRRRYVNLIECA